MRAQRDNTNTEFDELLLARAAATITITKISRSYHFLSTSCSITDKYFCQLLAESHSAVSLSVVLKCRHFFPYSDCMCLFPDYLSWPLSCPLYVVCFDYNLTVSTNSCSTGDMRRVSSEVSRNPSTFRSLNASDVKWCNFQMSGFSLSAGFVSRFSMEDFMFFTPSA